MSAKVRGGRSENRRHGGQAARGTCKRAGRGGGAQRAVPGRPRPVRPPSLPPAPGLTCASGSGGAALGGTRRRRGQRVPSAAGRGAAGGGRERRRRTQAERTRAAMVTCSQRAPRRSRRPARAAGRGGAITGGERRRRRQRPLAGGGRVEPCRGLSAPPHPAPPFPPAPVRRGSRHGAGPKQTGLMASQHTPERPVEPSRGTSRAHAQPVKGGSRSARLCR